MFSQLLHPSTKSSQIIQQKIQLMTDKLEGLRQSDFFINKSNIFQMELKKNKQSHTKSANRLLGLRKSEIIERPSKSGEIDQFLSCYQKNHKNLGTGNGLLVLKEAKMIKSQFIEISKQEDRGMGYRGQMKRQKSSSEMKYLQICSMQEQYVKEFMGILTDNEQQNLQPLQPGFNRDKYNTRITAISSQQSQKYLYKIQQQQAEDNSSLNRKTWQQRCRQAINKSKMAMEKAKMLPKFHRFKKNS